MTLIPVTDLKQWAYCQRIVYYHWVMPALAKPTYKMREAARAQDLIEGLEMRRSLSNYGLEVAQRRLNVWLSDSDLGLSGRADLLLETSDSVAAIDFKLTSGEVGENHRMQLTGYSLLAEKIYGRPARVAFLLRIPDGRVFPVAITTELKTKVLEAVRDIGVMIDLERLPERTPVSKRCAECEYANYCGDVW